MPVKDFFYKLPHQRTLRHLLFWLFILFALVIAKSASETQEQNFFSLLGRTSINLIPAVIAAYFLNFYLLPKLFHRKRYFSFFFLFVPSAYLICSFARVLNVHVTEPLFREGNFEQEPVAEIFVQFESLLTTYFPVIYFIAFSMAFIRQQKAQIKMKEKNVMLEKEKAEAELNFLKAQIHPHFLFNTLNNLYVLTLKKSDKAPETVIRLSEILDYILYKGNERAVAVEKEVQLLENYIALEQLRYGDLLKVSFTKSIDDNSIGISPLLLLSVVENAFKHGAAGQLNKPEIKIDLRLKNRQLYFRVYNTKSEFRQSGHSGYRKGIGVSNIRRQLALLFEEYNFETEEGKDFYLVKLSVNLNKHQAENSREVQQAVR